MKLDETEISDKDFCERPKNRSQSRIPIVGMNISAIPILLSLVLITGIAGDTKTTMSPNKDVKDVINHLAKAKDEQGLCYLQEKLPNLLLDHTDEERGQLEEVLYYLNKTAHEHMESYTCNATIKKIAVDTTMLSNSTENIDDVDLTISKNETTEEPTWIDDLEMEEDGHGQDGQEERKLCDDCAVESKDQDKFKTGIEAGSGRGLGVVSQLFIALGSILTAVMLLFILILVVKELGGTTPCSQSNPESPDASV